jgi:hypothetical protein
VGLRGLELVAKSDASAVKLKEKLNPRKENDGGYQKNIMTNPVDSHPHKETEQQPDEYFLQRNKVGHVYESEGKPECRFGRECDHLSSESHTSTFWHPKPIRDDFSIYPGAW